MYVASLDSLTSVLHPLLEHIHAEETLVGVEIAWHRYGLAREGPLPQVVLDIAVVPAQLRLIRCDAVVGCSVLRQQALSTIKRC